MRSAPRAGTYTYQVVHHDPSSDHETHEIHATHPNPETHETCDAPPKWRDALHAMRHRVYADELDQYARTSSKLLHDPGKDFVLCMHADGTLCGYLSWTPPPHTAFRMASFLTSAQMETVEAALGLTGGLAGDGVGDGVGMCLYEIRSLTVDPAYRQQGIARELMVRACLQIRQLGGTHVAALGRHGVLPMYQALGLKVMDEPQVLIGEAKYSVMQCALASVDRSIRDHLARPPAADGDDDACCYHGGSSWATTGFDFQRRDECVVADVLDSPFPPCPGVLDVLRTNLARCCMESPPTDSAPLVQAIAERRNIASDHLIVSSGSSSLMFTCLPRLLSRQSKVLILSPMYGEYKHILTNIVGCEVTEHELSRSDDFAVDVDSLYRQACHHDALIVVNPNSPTGQYSRDLPLLLERMFAHAKEPPRCRFVWVDETYVDYVPTAVSLETCIPLCAPLLVCKSMSKVYALSGHRVAYLAGQRVPTLRRYVPPWSVSLSAQLAGIAALADAAYYRAQFARVHTQRAALEAALRAMGFHLVKGCANFVLGFLPEFYMGTSEDFIYACRARKVFVRNAANMGMTLGQRAVRFAVRLGDEQQRLLQAAKEVLAAAADEGD